MIKSIPFCVREAALTRLRHAQKKLADAAILKAEADGPTPSSRALERSALDDMDAAQRLYDLAVSLEHAVGKPAA